MSIEEEFEKTTEIKKEGFRVTDLKSADWAMGKIKKYEQKKIEIAQFVTSKKAELEKYASDQNMELTSKQDFFKSLLLPYVEEQLKNEKKKKSIKLPTGLAGFRIQQPKYILNEAMLKPFVEKYDSKLIKTTTEVDWEEFKKQITISNTQAITSDGEVVPGITVEEKEPIFYVKVEG